MKRDTRPANRVEPDLTPMIDVVFLLLVFFMCTLSFSVLEGRLATQLPKDSGVARAAWMETLLPLELAVERDAARVGGVAVRIGARRRVDVGALPALIASKLALQSDLRAKISATDGVTYGQALSVLDACVMGGMTDVMFTVIPL